MKSLRILIVEDEILIAELIGTYLAEVGHIVADIAISYDEAVRSFNLQKPDLILLDIRLYGDKSGIEFSKYVASQPGNTPVIFLSSQYDQKTLGQALETNPYGYLTKPIQKQSLWTTISTCWKLFESNQDQDMEIKIYDGKFYHTLLVSHILYIQSEHIYSVFCLEDGKQIITRKTLKQCLEELSNSSFTQCHRSYLVNKKRIQSISIENIILDNEKVIPLSKNFKHSFL